MSTEQKSKIYTRLDSELGEDSRELNDRHKIVLAARILADEGHSGDLAGQITARSEEKPGCYLTLRIGRTFGDIAQEDICLIDDDLNVVDSGHQINPALRFHLWLYRARPDVCALVHTHAPYAAALSMTGQPLKVAHMDTAMFYNDCAYLADWPGVPFSDDEGRIISEAIGQKKTILLAHHGLLTTGTSIEEATYLAVFLERAARLQIRAQSAGTIREIRPEAAQEAHDFLLKPGVVNATFNAWAQKFATD